MENALNSRALISVSADPSDLNAITPNHFLLGEYSTGIPSLVGRNEFDHRKRYARAQSYANAIWSRWIREYVPNVDRFTRPPSRKTCNSFPNIFWAGGCYVDPVSLGF